jgi:hypothetical protein
MYHKLGIVQRNAHFVKRILHWRGHCSYYLCG